MNALNEQYTAAAEAVIADTTAILEALPENEALATAVEAADATRWGGVEDVRKLRALQPHLPELPETTATEKYEEIAEAEREWASPTLLTSGYGDGVARYSDEIRVARGTGYGPVLMSIDHATDPVRRATGVREGADHGTAGLGVVLAREGYGDAVIPVGRQTGNVNTNPTSVHKDVLASEMRDADTARLGFVSLHGKMPGRTVGLLDETEIHALLGLGRYQPNEATLAAADEIRRVAQDELGLRVEIANTTAWLDFKKDTLWTPGGPIRDKTSELVLDTEGRPKVTPEPTLAALGPGTTTNFIHEFLETNPDYPQIPRLQVEMSRSLRLTPVDQWRRPEQQMAMGVYMGYLLNKRIVEICRDLGASVRV